MDEKNINETNAQENGTANIEIINDKQTENIVGGYHGLFPKWQIIKTYCDFCNEKIDGKIRAEVPILGDKKMCDKCFEKQKKALGEDVAIAKWLGFSKNTGITKSKVDITNKNSNN